MKKYILIILIQALFIITAKTQNVGIGTDTPIQKLHVAGTGFISDSLGIGVANPQLTLDVNGRILLRNKPGDFGSGLFLNNLNNTSKAAFFGMANDTHVGLYSPNTGTYGLLLNTNNGNVGIGSGLYNPAYKLEVQGRMRILNGEGANNSPGIWLNKLDNSGEAAFIGMRDANIVGIYGTGNATWGMEMNTNTSRVSMAGGVDVAGLTIAGNSTITGNPNITGNLNVGANLTVSGTTGLGLEYVVSNNDIRASSYQQTFCACPAGKKVVGGGGGHRDYNDAQADITVNFSGPVSNGSGWRLLVTNNSNSVRAIQVWAICARIQ